MLHIPNNEVNGVSHGHNGNGHNGHDPHLYWIDHVLIPEFMLATGRVARKNFTYDFHLAEAAAKHAEYMMKIGRICHTPTHMMFGEAENVGMTEVWASDYEHAFQRVSEGFANDYVHGHNLDRFPLIGLGVAVKFDEKSLPLIYVVQRFARKAA